VAISHLLVPDLQRFRPNRVQHRQKALPKRKTKKVSKCSSTTFDPGTTKTKTIFPIHFHNAQSKVGGKDGRDWGVGRKEKRNEEGTYGLERVAKHDKRIGHSRPWVECETMKDEVLTRGARSTKERKRKEERKKKRQTVITKQKETQKESREQQKREDSRNS
jgi:hypothetical protein